jgi:hypothetical protein
MEDRMIQFTPQQRAEIERQRADQPAARHLRFQATAEQAAEIRRAAAAADSAKKAVEREFAMIVAAAAEPGFSGWLRRAIRNAQRPIQELALEAGIDAEQLRAFRRGEATLPSNAVDRLVLLLGLTLVEEPVSGDL